jgi:putative ABC transport system permease protein
MSWIGRFRNQFRRTRISSDLDEELAAHLHEAIARGRSAGEARRAFGSELLHRERSQDIRLLPRLDALTADVVFAWRQLKKNRVVSAAAVLSLALAIGATTAAFRLVDAVLWRTLPVVAPERLFFLAVSNSGAEGRLPYNEAFDYPTFREYRQILGDRADVMLLGTPFRQGAMFDPSDEPEPVYRQFVSGNVFGVFGIQPALGRLLAPNDDLKPGAHPVAVLSYDYWTRRFGRDPKVLGKTFHIVKDQYEIVGVAARGFIGTEPGVVTDVFIPSMMNTQALDSPGWSWFRIWVRPKAAITPEQVRQPLQAALMREQQERIKTLSSDTPKQAIDAYLSHAVNLLPAASGASDLQRGFRVPLLILGVLVVLVLLVACVNVGNLLAAQAAARAREMALRVSIGAGRGRLIQMVLVESALLAIIASALGTLFAWWVAPRVVSMLAPADDPVRLMLDVNWRAIGFGVALTAAVTFLFGLAPALRASSVKPMNALKGGEDLHTRRRLMSGLVAAQMAFCVLVLFVAGLFVTTFERLSNRPLGFSQKGILLLETDFGAKRPPAVPMQVAERLRRISGVEAVSLAGWGLLSGNGWIGTVRVAGRPIEVLSPYFLDVSPGFFETMRIGLIGGRDFRAGDGAPHLEGRNQPVGGVGIVNEAFARTYFDGQNPVGRSVDVRQGKDLNAPLEIVGYVRDASYRNLREPIRPTVYFPMADKAGGTFIVRTANDSLTLAPLLRREVSQAGSGFHVRGIDTQSSLVRRQLIRERLLATLSMFFATVALALAAIGLYGVLNYSVVQQRREIGIRLALGARSAHVVRRVTAGIFGMVFLGLAIGLALGLASGRFLEALLFGVKTNDLSVVAAPILTLLCAVVLAALPPVIRAVRIDPAQTLRSE